MHASRLTGIRRGRIVHIVGKDLYLLSVEAIQSAHRTDPDKTKSILPYTPDRTVVQALADAKPSKIERRRLSIGDCHTEDTKHHERSSDHIRRFPKYKFSGYVTLSNPLIYKTAKP